MSHRFAIRFALALCFAQGAGCGDDDLPATEGTNPGECSDGADNDADGTFDCLDSDCFGAPVCASMDAATRDGGPSDVGPSDVGADGDAAMDAGGSDGGMVLRDGGAGDVALDVTPDVPMMDAGPPPPSVCDEGIHDDALICDGYEGASMGMVFGAMPDDGDAYRGTASLLAPVRPGDGFYGYFYTIPATDTALHARFYLFQPSNYSPTHGPIWFQGADHTVAVITGGGETRYFVDRHSDGLDSNRVPAAVPLGRWTCVQVEVAPGDDDGRLHIRYDGTTVLGETNLNIPGGVTRIAVGALSGQEFFGAVTEVRIDDLVVDTDIIPCD